MRKGIEAAITIVILLLVAVAIVGLVYAFIAGFFGTITGKVALVGGSSPCTSEDYGFTGIPGTPLPIQLEGVVNIVLRNVGSAPIDLRPSSLGGDLTIVRILRVPAGPASDPFWLPKSGNTLFCNNAAVPCLLNPEASIVLVELLDTQNTPPTYLHCGAGNSCTYAVTVGGITYTTRADC